jgi:Rps23 Pro-64 3,4-dihydroxylase Tpa1-like proline 4-hydroxylase
MELINPFDRMAVRDKVRNAKPFPHFSIDNFLNEDFANEIYRSFPSFEHARAVGKEFASVNEKYKIQITDAKTFPPAIAKLNDLLATPDFVEMVGYLLDVPNLLADAELVGGGIHETNSGGRLDVHVDFNYIEERQLHRRVNILIYFNKDWREEYGGYLDFWDKEVENCHAAFAPIFNRACGFVTSEISFHGVTPLTCPPGVVRKSFATYYYTKEAPAYWDGTVHSTIFKARPHEWMRKHVLMNAEGTVATAKERLRGVKRAIKKLAGM